MQRLRDRDVIVCAVGAMAGAMNHLAVAASRPSRLAKSLASEQLVAMLVARGVWRLDPRPPLLM